MLNPESNFTRREKNHSLFHLKYIDVSRTTHTNLDVKQEKTHRWLLEYRWLSRLVWSLDRFHTIYSTRRKSSWRIYLVRGRLKKKQLTSRPDHLCPELWKSMGKECKAEGKAKVVWRKDSSWQRTKTAREFISSTQRIRNSRKPSRNARKKLETSLAPAMPCKIMKNCGSGGSDKNKTKLACVLEANVSTRMSMGNSPPSNHEDHIAGKAEHSLQHYNLVHNFFLCLKLWKFLQQKQRWTRNGKNWRKFSAWNLTKVKSKKQVIDEARTSGAKVHFASLMDICHLKNAELEAKHQKYKGRVVLRGDIVKDDSGVLCSVHWTRIFSISNDSS